LQHPALQGEEKQEKGVTPSQFGQTQREAHGENCAFLLKRQASPHKERFVENTRL
jgi:hypothetical protein